MTMLTQLLITAAKQKAKPYSLSDGQRLALFVQVPASTCFHDRAYFKLAGLEADEYANGSSGTWTRGFLIRCHITGDDLAFFTT